MKSLMNKALFIMLALLMLAYSASAQCVMCRTAIENDKDVAEGVNNGILYLMVIPYVFLAITLYIVIKNRRQRKAEGEE